MIITLLTDFGSKDTYVAEMKGVVLSICPRATIVDLTHEVESFNIRSGAYLLARAAGFFPRGTIHVAVVDPGVGGPRKPVVLATRRYFFVGPDNGLMHLAASKDGLRAAYEIRADRFWASRVSATFHGRDVFARAAALLACGVALPKLGSRMSPQTLVAPSFSEVKAQRGWVEGEVIHIDRFGNLVTNVGEKALSHAGFRKHHPLTVAVEGCRPVKAHYATTYSDVSVGSFLALVGSGGFLELSVNQGNAARRLRAKIGRKARFSASDSERR